MVRKDLAGDAIHFSPDLRTCDDWECFGRVARCGPAAYLDTETAWQHGHSGPRITRLSMHAFLSARLIVTERVWGADAKFQARHADRYRQVVRSLLARRARWLIRQGRPAEARADLRAAGGGPLGLRALARLPGPFVHGLLRVLKGSSDDRQDA